VRSLRERSVFLFISWVDGGRYRDGAVGLWFWGDDYMFDSFCILLLSFL
jgi:hypothetical protein